MDNSLFAAGDRVCVAVSGGADSTALLRALLAQREDLGIVLSVLHVEHGLRGAVAVADAAFVADLAEKFSLPCQIVAVDTQKRAAEQKESIEEAARNLRYQLFREVLSSGHADKIATAHTLDDQAETVLMKLLRGAWTEGLSGIHPVLRLEEAIAGQNAGQNVVQGGLCIRPFLAVRRMEIESYLQALGQTWREDPTNRSLAHTRNRVRHQLLPLLREYNPQIEQTLAHMAANARAEEKHWQRELTRLLPRLLLPGKPVRGGGRSVATKPGLTAVALELAKLQALDEGMRRRVLRAVAERCGATLDFDGTERLLHMADEKKPAAHSLRAGRWLDLPSNVRVERTARELQFEPRQRGALAEKLLTEKVLSADPSASAPVYVLPVPGTVDAPAFGARYEAKLMDNRGLGELAAPLPAACVRAWRPGDRITVRHSRGPKKVKEVLERMQIRGEERRCWPVVVWQGKIVWMRGVDLAIDEDRDRTGEEHRAHGVSIPVPPTLRCSEIALQIKDFDTGV